MTNPLSPAAQAVVDAWDAKLNPDPDGLTYLTHDPEREALAAALQAVVDNWKSEISGQPSTEFIQGINNCIAALQEIAAELRAQP